MQALSAHPAAAATASEQKQRHTTAKTFAAELFSQLSVELDILPVPGSVLCFRMSVNMSVNICVLIRSPGCPRAANLVPPRARAADEYRHRPRANRHPPHSKLCPGDANLTPPAQANRDTAPGAAVTQDLHACCGWLGTQIHTTAHTLCLTQSYYTQ